MQLKMMLLKSEKRFKCVIIQFMKRPKSFRRSLRFVTLLLIKQRHHIKLLRLLSQRLLLLQAHFPLAEYLHHLDDCYQFILK